MNKSCILKSRKFKPSKYGGLTEVLVYQEYTSLCNTNDCRIQATVTMHKVVYALLLKGTHCLLVFKSMKVNYGKKNNMAKSYGCFKRARKCCNTHRLLAYFERCVAEEWE